MGEFVVADEDEEEQASLLFQWPMRMRGNKWVSWWGETNKFAVADEEGWASYHKWQWLGQTSKFALPVANEDEEKWVSSLMRQNKQVCGGQGGGMSKLPQTIVTRANKQVHWQWGEGTSLQWPMETRRNKEVITNNGEGNEHVCCSQWGQGGQISWPQTMAITATGNE